MNLRRRLRIALVAGVLAPLGMVLGGVLLARILRGESLVQALAGPPAGVGRSLREALPWALGGAGVSLGVSALLASVWPQFGKALERTGIQSGSEVLRLAGWPVLLLVVAAGAVGEEVLFRGGIQPSLGVWPTATAFGLAHGGWQLREMWSYVMAAGLAGLAFGYAYEWSGTLWAPVLAHVVHNGAVVAYLLYRQRRGEPERAEAGAVEAAAGPAVIPTQGEVLGMLAMARIRQNLPRPRVEDVPAAVRAELRRLEGRVRPGMTVAVTAGSRGIAGIPAILRAVVGTLREMGAEPFLVAAMGSHGGGTAAGQAELLAHLGITEESVGAPLRVTDQAVAVGTTASGHVLYCDAEAARADAILLVNRVKPHTSFRGSLESGLFKILTVGLGKVPGARQVHRLGAPEIYPAIREMGRLGLERLPILGGLAILENGYEETAKVRLLLPEEMEAGEERLLEEARSLLPGLPVRDLDLLIVEEMGKNYSGTGMDTNVIGRWRVPGMPEPEWPRIGRIVVLRLSEASAGNANGVGLADFTTRRLADAIDWDKTLTNIATSGFWFRAMCPPALPSDRSAIEWAIRSLEALKGEPVDPGRLRAARIRSTLHLEELWVTAPVLEEVLAAGTCEALTPLEPLRFSGEGDLLPGA
ncbi:CPBP family glutamic-type intramembrane protease [Caldinitratiruptor microaerophilus]|uniref:CAAX prenyl protease 2/Lysostaphin resistance protein A-like domain-containing protein n=1 Tax=Caldinitratiruptor microaerophilus TaxID=671077 RepID=A0AA35CRD0_9FIRM|nr:CPBP family glutamic-type intramembrane protease [Caldinitratiruptor microaerophilus]BDG62395.1 hypothetical protein caldi_34850 [Caldinitratiruptor microaerophilus]